MLRFLLLGLLARRARYGYELKGILDHFLGGTWPLDLAQIYITLGRLEREGLIASTMVPQELVPDRKVYSLTEEGLQELKAWIEEPTEGPIRLRDEIFLKILVRSVVKPEDRLALVFKQREAHLRLLARLSEMRSDPSIERSAALLLEGAIIRAESDLKWLELCEEWLG